MRIDCCAACGGGRHNAPTRSPTSQAHTYRRACAPLRHVAPLGRTAHSVALYSRQRNGTPAATVRRSWLSCQSQSECVPFANFAKNSEIFRNCAEIRKEKEKKHNFGKFIFCGNLLAAPSLRWRSVLVAVTPTLDLAGASPVAPSSLPSENEYIPLFIFFVLLLRLRFAGNARPCGYCRWWACAVLRSAAVLAARVPVVADCICAARSLPLPCGFSPPSGRRSKARQRHTLRECVCFSPCPSAFCQRYHKKFFLSNHTVIRHYQNYTNND